VFKLLATDRDDVPQLHDVRRFRHEWERDASLKLRTGRSTAADDYDRHGRVIGGDRDTVLDALFTAWQTDITAGRTSLMIAADAQTVTDLNTRARASRVTTGDVSEEGVTVRDGTTIGAGDHIVTRLNQRDIVTGDGPNRALGRVGEWVKNGDQWIVTRTFPDGSLRVRRPVGGRSVTLPAEYVSEHVELGYATTAHRAQGRTVDTAHAYVTATTTREPLYVMATRGRESNRLYVDTMYDPDVATAHDDIEPMQPAEVLKAVLARPGSDTSATATRVAEGAAAASPSRLAAEGAAVLESRREDRYLEILKKAGITDEEIDHAKRADTLRRLIARMHHAERIGINLEARHDVPVGLERGAPLGVHRGADALKDYEASLVRQMTRSQERRQQHLALAPDVREWEFHLAP
jgi:hypothetical protein